MQVDRNSTTPLYIQLAEFIRRDIEQNKLKPGQQMLSEIEMIEKYGVSRITVRQAYQQLVDEGILVRIKGKGTFVTHEEPGQWGCLESFTKETYKKGSVPKTKIIQFQITEPPQEVSERLHLAPGETCYYFKRLRYIDNHPVCLAKTYIPCSLVENLSPDYFSEQGYSQSIFHVLEENFGIQFYSGDETTSATCVINQDASLLGVEDQQPTIIKTCVIFDPHNRPIIFESVTWATDFKTRLKKI